MSKNEAVTNIPDEIREIKSFILIYEEDCLNRDYVDFEDLQDIMLSEAKSRYAGSFPCLQQAGM